MREGDLLCSGQRDAAGQLVTVRVSWVEHGSGSGMWRLRRCYIKGGAISADRPDLNSYDVDLRWVGGLPHAVRSCTAPAPFP